LKKIIYYLGIIFLTIVVVLNIIFTTKLDLKENIEISFNNIFYIISIIFIISLLIFFTQKCNKLFKNTLENQKNIKIIIILLLIFNILWISFFRPPIVGDPVQIYELSRVFYGDTNLLNSITYAKIPLSQYIEAYHHQIPLALLLSIIFKIMHFHSIEIIRILNILSNLLIATMIYKINNKLSKNFKNNNLLLFLIILTFFPLTMLSTFIYGDIISLSLCLCSVYFVMIYRNKKNFKNFIIFSLFSMLAYMVRMNSLIFIIAIILYLILDIFNEITTKTLKNIFKQLFVVLLFCVIVFIPTLLVKNLCLRCLGLNTNKEYPNISYFLMGMQESSKRGYGWYDEKIAEPALKKSDKAEIKEEYTQKIKERLIYFSKNITYTFKFYTIKIASMWTENTYSSVRNNMVGKNYNFLENIINPLTFYEKVLLIIICLGCLNFLITNKDNISLDELLLITIFIGGFLFHILWEAKSRYIIPYIVILIPLSSIYIKKD